MPESSMFNAKKITIESTLEEIGGYMDKHPWHKFRCDRCDEIEIMPAAIVIMDKDWPCIHCRSGYVWHQEDCECAAR